MFNSKKNIKKQRKESDFFYKGGGFLERDSIRA